MTLTQALDFLRNRLNATGTPSYYADEELRALISARAQTVGALLGLIEEIDTSTTTVASTQSYAWPTDAISIVRVYYDGDLLQEITHREWELEKQNGVTPEGDVEKYVPWNRQLILVPTPSDAKTLTIYYEPIHPWIGNANDTIDLPAATHLGLLDGCLSDMYAKAETLNMAQFYENKWREHLVTTFPSIKNRLKNRSRHKVLVDADTLRSSDRGVR